MEKAWWEKVVYPSIKFGMPDDYALHAFKEKYYFEAVAVLHQWLHRVLCNLVYLYRHQSKKGDLNRVQNEIENTSIIESARILFIYGFITAQQYDKIRKFNSVRNQLFHSLFYESSPYGGHKHYDLDEFKVIFLATHKLLVVLQNREPGLATRKSTRKIKNFKT